MRNINITRKVILIIVNRNKKLIRAAIKTFSVILIALVLTATPVLTAIPGSEEAPDCATVISMNAMTVYAETQAANETQVANEVQATDGAQATGQTQAGDTADTQNGDADVADIDENSSQDDAELDAEFTLDESEELNVPVQSGDDWPELSGTVSAEGACLMDARSGAVLYGKNMHESYYPASITKILTALLVIENCDNLDDTLTFSHRAIYDVESGSSNAGYSEGDTVTVRTALYALLLASANEAANALAEYTAGSMEAFCDLMNAKAQELGCTDTHFANPSGLNNEEHYTSAYDFAKICREAFKNDTFVQINGTTIYDLPPMARQPDGYTIYAHHNMLKKSNPLYYEGIIGGKTGYTSLAGNTLVTCAERDGLRLITVVLNGHKTHYDDTKTLLDFGFENFKSVNPSDYKTKFDTVFDSMDITGQGVLGADVISTSKTDYITLPKDAEFESAETEIVYDLNEDAPEDACAEIKYKYGTHSVGSQYVKRKYSNEETVIAIGDPVEEAEQLEDETITTKTKNLFVESPLWMKILMIVIALAVIAGIVALIIMLTSRRRRVEFRMPSNPGHSRKRK